MEKKMEYSSNKEMLRRLKEKRATLFLHTKGRGKVATTTQASSFYPVHDALSFLLTK